MVYGDKHGGGREKMPPYSGRALEGCWAPPIFGPLLCDQCSQFVQKCHKIPWKKLTPLEHPQYENPNDAIGG